MQISLYDSENRLEKITKLGDVLEQLNSIVEWKIFVPLLNRAIPRIISDKGGRPPKDNLLMFKIIVIKRLFNLSHEQTEYQINDRISFMRFLGLGINDIVPDEKTIWLYENMLSESEIGKELFEVFNASIAHAGYITRTGSIVDASFIEAPRRKNTKEQRESLKKGEVPEEWNDADHPQKIMQRDTDATWTKKGNEAHFGYKDHVKVDADSKLIVDYNITTASTKELCKNKLNSTQRRNNVIPVSMRRDFRNIDSVKFGIADLDSRKIFVGVMLTNHFQAFGSRCIGNQIHNGFNVNQRFTSPVF
jgi:IS5 family transposase